MTQSKIGCPPRAGVTWSSGRSTACIGKGTANTLQAFPFHPQHPAWETGDYQGLLLVVEPVKQSAGWPGWTQPIQLHLTSGREQKSCASELSKWHSVGLVVCAMGCTETAEIWYEKKKKNEPPLPIRIPSKMTLRGSVAKKIELFSFLQAPVMFALGFTKNKLWTREDMFISSVD